MRKSRKTGGKAERYPIDQRRETMNGPGHGSFCVQMQVEWIPGPDSPP